MLFFRNTRTGAPNEGVLTEYPQTSNSLNIADFQCEASPISCVLSTLNSEIRSLVVIRTLNVREEITSDKFPPQTLTSDDIYNSILRHSLSREKKECQKRCETTQNNPQKYILKRGSLSTTSRNPNANIPTSNKFSQLRLCNSFFSYGNQPF